MSALSVTLRGRRAAEALMVDACIIDRPSGQSTDPSTGQVVKTYSAAFYTGRCRVQQVGTQASNPNAGERQLTVIGHVVQLPIDATAYRVGDRVTITTGTLDPALVGRVFTVTSWIPKSHDTMRRLVCDETAA